MERERLPPIAAAPDEAITLLLDQVVVKSHVGKLVKSFERKAARTFRFSLFCSSSTVSTA